MTVEEMEAAMYLVADDVIGLSRHDSEIKPFVMCNDFFAPAADGEDIEWNELPELLKRVRSGGEREGLRWVAERRGVPFVYWRDKYAKANQKGQGLVEYTLIVILVALVFWVAIRNTDVGNQLSLGWSRVAQCVADPSNCGAGS